MHKEIADLVKESVEERDLVIPLCSRNPIISTGAKIIAVVSNNTEDPIIPQTIFAIYDGMNSGLDSEDVGVLIAKGFNLKNTWED